MSKVYVVIIPSMQVGFLLSCVTWRLDQKHYSDIGFPIAILALSAIGLAGLIYALRKQRTQ